MSSAPAEKENNEEAVFQQALLIGPWKQFFSTGQYKLMIAEAMNYCYLHRHLKINGYLLTNRRLFLILTCKRKEIEKTMAVFYAYMRREILKKLHEKNQGHLAAEQLGNAWRVFKATPLHNEPLVKLITGRPVDLPYYSPHLARLENYIQNYAYCSAMDYAGGKGPVFVKRLT